MRADATPKRLGSHARLRPWLALVALSLGLSAESSALARPVAEGEASRQDEADAPVPSGNSLRGRISAAGAERWLSRDAASRLRAFERLASIGEPMALELLISALQKTESALERLALVRALAAHHKNVRVRRALIQVVTGVPSGTALEYDQLARETAALILAASQQSDAWGVLAKALYQDGPIGRAAAVAAMAYPPKVIGPLLASPPSPSQHAVRVLGQLGDQRLFHTLRRHVKRGSLAVRAEAALALTRLGALETVPLAERWLEKEPSAELRLAAAEILTLTGSPQAPRAIQSLLRVPELKLQALELVAKAPAPEFAPALIEALGARPSDAPRLIGLLGRCGGDRAFQQLTRLVSDPQQRAAAVYALARLPDERVAPQLTRWFGSPELRRWAVRAGVVRSALFATPVEGLDDASAALARSAHPAERAVGQWAQRQRGSQELTQRLAPFTQATDVQLLDWATGEGPERYMAGRFLAARYQSEQRESLENLLESGDPLFRAHLALGLGENPAGENLGLLRRLYLFETAASVRRAIVRALSQRPETARLGFLEQVRTLDPDAEARQLAGLALGGQRLTPDVAGVEVVWLKLHTLAPGSGAPARRDHAPRAIIVTATGLALPALADADDMVVLLGLPAGPVEVRVESRQHEG